MSRKIGPERREEIRRLNEEGRRARASMQQVVERVEARLLAERERAERRSGRLRRVLSLGRPNRAT